jgi:hypothetical protein
MRSIKVLGELRRLQLGPRPLQTRPELRQHVPHAALAARQVVDQVRAHRRPAQSRAIDDRFIELAGGGDAVVDHVQNLAPQRLLQTIGQVAGNFAPHMQRMHADVGEELGRRIDGALRGLFPPTNSTNGSRYTGLNGCATQKRSGATMSRCKSVGVRPEVLEAMITSAAHGG